MQYRRAHAKGGTYFFTVNLANRQSDLLVTHIQVLREVIRYVKNAHPFALEAMVVLPEHLHAIWRLPVGDADYPKRWSLIKSGFSKKLDKTELIRPSRQIKRERGIWQRRYWEHQIKDEIDFEKHVDYIHYNPVKHGYVRKANEWPYSTLHRFIKQGILPENWADGTSVTDFSNGER